jgi:hypothetical protein
MATKALLVAAQDGFGAQRWLRVVMASAVLALGVISLAPARAHAIGSCPPIGADTSCGYLITITSNGPPTVQADTTQPAYENSDDVTVGVVNNSSKSVSSLPLSSPGSDLFSFESDGICDPGSGPVAPGCQVTPGSPAGTMCGAQSQACSFPPPPGEPAKYTEFGASAGNGAMPWPNGDLQNGYEGPNNWFSLPSMTDLSSGVVDFGPPLAPGQFTYFGLEQPPSGAGITAGTPATTGPSTPPPTTTKTLPPAFGKSGVIQIPSSKKCLSKRHFTIHVVKRKGLSYTEAIVFVNHKQVGTIRAGSRFSAGVDLRNLPAGTFKVELTVITTAGQIIKGTRTYHTCRKHLPFLGPPKL